MFWLRNEVCRLYEAHRSDSGLMQHYMANYWLAKFYTMAFHLTGEQSRVFLVRGGGEI